jgi:hypothetical protein
VGRFRRRWPETSLAASSSLVASRRFADDRAAWLGAGRMWICAGGLCGIGLSGMMSSI